MNRFFNCYCNYVGSKKPKISKQCFNNFYLKLRLTDTYNNKIKVKSNDLILEIVDIDIKNLNNIDKLKEFLNRLGVKRVVISYSVLREKDFLKTGDLWQIFKKLKTISFDNIAVDFYLGNLPDTIAIDIKKFLKEFSFIKHLSLYFIDDEYPGIFINNEFDGFVKYHKHMWSKPGYQNLFQLTVLLEKNCLGLGTGAISRLGNSFYKYQEDCEPPIKEIESLSEKLIDLSDVYDRLSFYLEVSASKIEKRWQQLKEWKYQDLLIEFDNDKYKVHDYLMDACINQET